MRFKCINQSCGRTVEVAPGQPAPKFCTSCGSNLKQEGGEELNPDQTAETVGDPGTTLFRRLTEMTTKTVEHTTTSTRKPKSINTGILSGLPVTGPPEAEPEDIPLFRVVAAPPGLLHDDEIPARQDDAPAGGQSVSVEEVVAGEDSDDLFGNLGEVGIEEKEPSTAAPWGAADQAGAADQVIKIDADDDQFFAMLSAQTPESIVKTGGVAELGYSPPELHAPSPAPEIPVEEEEEEEPNEPAPKAFDDDSDTAVESSDGAVGTGLLPVQEDTDLMRMLQDDAPENPETVFDPSLVSVRTAENEFADSAAVLGRLEPGDAPGENFLQVLLESLRYVLRGSGAHLLIFSVVLWIVTLTLLIKVGPYAAAPLMLIQLLLVTCTGLISILLGSKGHKAALHWPAGEGWAVLLRCLLRFAPMDLLLAGLAFVSGFIAKGYLLLLPILMVTSSMILCLDSKWKNVFSPKRHLRLLTANPLVILRILGLGCVLGMLIPVSLGLIISRFTGGAMNFWMLKLAFWFCLSGPIGWVAGTAGGYGIGLLYAAKADQFDEDAPEKGYEYTVGAGLLGICLLLSFVF